MLGDHERPHDHQDPQRPGTGAARAWRIRASVSASRSSIPRIAPKTSAIDRLEAIAWDAYREGRKAPITRKAGPGYADPDYDLSVEWIETKERLERAQKVWADPKTQTRALVICGSPRNDGTCPGEISKTFRLAGLVQRRAGAGAGSRSTSST